MVEISTVMIYPSQVGVAGFMLGMLDPCGEKIADIAVANLRRETVEAHYAPHREKPFFPLLVNSLVGQCVVVAAYEGEKVVDKIMDVTGRRTNPLECVPGTIRRMFGDDSVVAALAENRVMRCVIHRSDCPKEGEREFRVWEPYFQL